MDAVLLLVDWSFAAETLAKPDVEREDTSSLNPAFNL